MKYRKLSAHGPKVSAIGLGCMAMSGMYGTSDQAESIATLYAALDRGITLLDTGDFYGMGHNELLIAKALAGHKRDDVFIQVKFGAQRDPAGNWLGNDARPAAVKTSLAYTLNRLNTEYTISISLHVWMRVCQLKKPSAPSQRWSGGIRAPYWPFGNGCTNNPARTQGASHHGFANGILAYEP